MASPHVAGLVALMQEKYAALTAAEAEEILESTALYLDEGCVEVLTPNGIKTFCWGDDATGAGLVDAAAVLEATP